MNLPASAEPPPAVLPIVRSPPMRSRKTSAFVVGAVVAVLAAAGITPAAGATATHYTGTLADGATWIADVPANWNGTLVLYSHGFGLLTAQDAITSQAGAALLAQGYALAGSSYDPNGSLWALNSAVQDQFATVTAFGQRVGRPQHTIATGASMGGLVNSIIAQNSSGRIDGSVNFCGLVAGGVELTNYHLNGEYAIKKLIPGAFLVPLRGYNSIVEGAAAGTALQTTIALAQGTAAGRARIALAAALLNETDWASGATPPAPTDFLGQEQQEEQTLTGGQLAILTTSEYSIEQAVGGDPASNVGVDYGALVRSSPYYAQLKALYAQAGLGLDADVATLNRGATYRSEGDSLRNTQLTATNTGSLPVPELDIHTIADQLVPVQEENAYAQRVQAAGDSANLRQAYVAAIGHCNFTAADIAAAVDTVAARIQTGSWGRTDAGSLNATANALPGLGGGNFLEYQPTKLVVH
ncbi:DUF6351 family protein [Streptacidiphilus cavernicola]|uniref:DUF6351 family protein n=1 Tax=Streptacidiphilus cavernicola TaxID=3342716 RepID=A0ABV6W575_9ACTN